MLGWLSLALPLACAPQGPSSRDEDTAAVDSDDPADTDVSAAAIVDRHVALPFATVGEAAPTGPLGILAPNGTDDPLTVEVIAGPFAVAGDLGPLAAGAPRTLTVGYTGATDAPALISGAAVVTVDGQDHVVTLAAVIGDAGLPAADWLTDGWGTVTTVKLPSAAYPADGGDAWADGSVLIAVPPAISETGAVHVVTHFHGHGAWLPRTVATHRLVEQHTIGGRDAILVVPQGPIEASSGDFGQLMDAGGHERLIRDVIAVLYRDGLVRDAIVGQQALTAHSGGYLATAAVLDAGGLPIDAAHLFDALYGRRSTFRDFAGDGGILRSSATASGGTVDQNDLLADELATDGVIVGTTFDDAALGAVDVTIGASPSSHTNDPVDRRGYARWLAESGLPPRPGAPPELLAVEAEGDGVRVRWRIDRALHDRVVVVEGSEDGASWSELGRGSSDLTVPTAPFVRVRAVTGEIRSEPGDVYGATGRDWLVVDGFDRVFGGSWTAPTHAFVARVGGALGAGWSSASNEAIAEGLVDPTGYGGVIWLLGDESTGDDTFDAAERAAIERVVAAGVPLIVSGGEVAYATDRAWLGDVLGATYVADDANTTTAGGFTFGVAYPEDYPDVLGGGTTLWTYATGGSAAVVSGNVAVVGFPVETIGDDQLAEALAELVAALPQ